MLGPTLETERLILRPPTHADFDGFAAMSAEAETMRFLGGRQERDAAWRSMAVLAGSWMLQGFGMFSVIEKQSGVWIGRVGPWHPGGEDSGWPGAEVGWGVRRAFAGKGYAFEAAEAAMDWAFEHLSWSEVIHCIEHNNARSIALAHRLGSSKLRQARLPAPNSSRHRRLWPEPRGMACASRLALALRKAAKQVYAMKHVLNAAFLALALIGAAQAQEAAPVPPQVQRTLDQLRERALQSDNAFSIVESLTTEVGPRLAGSEQEARARIWAQSMLRAQGLSRVRVEPFTIPFWRAEMQSAEIVSPAPQRLETVALAGSPSTPADGLRGEVVRFTSLAQLQAAPRARVQGRIVFLDEGMARTQDGAGYGLAVERRARCPALAQAQGALACVIRSVGTDSHRFAHQGGNALQATGVSLPAAAISNPDADQLARLLSRGPVRLKLNLQIESRDDAPSGNVIAEVRGREHPEQIVLLGAHLNSWDQGTGAVDDGAGVAIVTAAAALIADLPRAPRRTIRVVLFGAEETGVRGGAAYANAHAGEIANHIIASESDFGAGPVWAVQTRFGSGADVYKRALHAALRPLSISLQDGEAQGGADVRALRDAGVPVFGLRQDGRDYFDVHHTADDTLDKVDRAGLRQNVAAWAVAAYLAAEMDWDFRAAH